jgi:HlyD family secretion protein
LEREALVHQVAQAKAKLARAQHDLELADIRSPIDGVVLERYEQGDRTLPAGEKLLLVGNLDELEAVADVLTQDALRIGVGSEVSISPYTAALGLEPIPGRVKRIEPQGFTKTSSLGVEQQRVVVIITIGSEETRDEGRGTRGEGRGARDAGGFPRPPSLVPRPPLGVGYRMQARFFTGSKTDALIVPRFSVLQAAPSTKLRAVSMVESADRSFYVFKVVDGRLKRQAVRIGIRSDLELEVTEGLSPDDAIVAEPDTTMKDGMTVNVKG